MADAPSAAASADAQPPADKQKQAKAAKPTKAKKKDEELTKPLEVREIVRTGGEGDRAQRGRDVCSCPSSPRSSRTASRFTTSARRVARPSSPVRGSTAR